MSANRPMPIDGPTAERLLDHPDHADLRDHPVAAVIREATAPGAARALPGEEQFLLACRAAHLDAAPAAPAPTVPQRRQSMIKFALAKLLTAKIAIGAATAVAAGGVALAAGAGAVPNPLADQTAPPASAAADAGKDAAASPSPNLVGLCRAYTKGAADNPGKALESPAFKALVTAAGGEDQVAGYCEDLLASKPGGDAPDKRPTDTPTGPRGHHPTGAPTDAPTSRPTDARTERPTSTPEHPTGSPTGRPGA